MSTEKIISQVSGTVWKIECAAGQYVAEGDTIMVLESMKMEIPVLAPVAGRLESLAVSEGDVVEEDATLGEITK